MTIAAAATVSVSPVTPAVDLAVIKARQQTTWASGDYGVVGVTLQIVGEALCEAVGVEAGERVVDVAAGNGNASLAAARRFANVTSTDYVPALLEQGRRRADADRLPIATPIQGLYEASMFQVYPHDRGQNYSILLAEQLITHLATTGHA